MKMYSRWLLHFQRISNLICLGRYSTIEKLKFLPHCAVSSFIRIPATSVISDNHQIRNYVKGREKVKSGQKKVQIREDLIAEHLNVRKFKEEMQQILDRMKEQYINTVSLRSSLGSVEAIKVEFEGEEYTIGDLAQVNRKNPKVLALNLNAFPQTIPTVIEALNTCGMNLNPQQDGNSIYVPIPKVTKEHRENLAKNANAIFLKRKEDIVEVQRKYLRKLEIKQNEGLSLELFLMLKDQITALVNAYIGEAKKMKDDKTKELTGE